MCVLARIIGCYAHQQVACLCILVRPPCRPLADMANHSTSPNAAFKLDPASQTFSLTACQVRRRGHSLHTVIWWWQLEVVTWCCLTHPAHTESVPYRSTCNATCTCSPARLAFCIFLLVQAIPAGAEVLISYLGEKPSKSNVELMKAYGFVTPGNINDTISFDMASGGLTMRHAG